jgi:plasmid stabilization system protein ParE
MKIGYEILWTENALNELEKTISYLKENWTEKEIRKLALAVEKTVLLLTKNPLLFPESDKKRHS